MSLKELQSLKIKEYSSKLHQLVARTIAKLNEFADAFNCKIVESETDNFEILKRKIGINAPAFSLEENIKEK